MKSAALIPIAFSALACCRLAAGLPPVTIEELCASIRQAEAGIRSLTVHEEQMRAEWNGTDFGNIGRVLEQADVQYRMADGWAKEYSRSGRFVPEGGEQGPAPPQLLYSMDAFNGRFGTSLADSIGIVRGERPELLHRSVLHELYHPSGMHLADIFLQEHILAVVEGERTVADADCYSVLLRNRKAFSETGAYLGTWGRYAIAPRYGFVAVEVLSGRMEQGKEWTRRTYRFSEFTQGADGFWTPRRRDVWVEARGSAAPGTHSIVQIKDASVNVPFADSDFAVDFPPGARVQDWRQARSETHPQQPAGAADPAGRGAAQP